MTDLRKMGAGMPIRTLVNRLVDNVAIYVDDEKVAMVRDIKKEPGRYKATLDKIVVEQQWTSAWGLNIITKEEI